MSTPKSPKIKPDTIVYNFESYNLSLTEAHSAVLLLESPEPNVLFETIQALTKYIRQDNETLNVIYEYGAIPIVLNYIEHPQLKVRRLSLKFIAHMCASKDVRRQILSDKSSIRRLAQQIVKVEDVFVLEYASLCLSKLTSFEDGCVQLLEANVLNSLFKRMRESCDPDVQMNCLLSLNNLLKFKATASVVPKNQFFSWPTILFLAQSKYTKLQKIALDMITSIIARHHDKVLQSKFRDCAATNQLFEILQNFYFRDVHSNVLNILSKFLQTEVNAHYFYKAGYIPPLMLYIERCMPDVKPRCLEVFTVLSNTVLGRGALYDSKSDVIFCECLKDTSCHETLSFAALGVANMCNMIVSAIRMFNTGVVKALCMLLGDDSLPWVGVRLNVLQALTELSRLVREAASLLTERNTFYALRSINTNYTDYPIEAQQMALKCFVNILTYHIEIGAMQNQEFINEMLSVIKRLDNALNERACKVLSGLFKDEQAKMFFSMNRGEEVISEFLKVENKKFQSSICHLIISTASSRTAEDLHKLGTLEYMWKKTDFLYTVKNWDVALSLLLKNHLPSKFAFTGVLEFDDLTKDEFYVVKYLKSHLPSLEDLMKQKPPYQYTAYVCTIKQYESKANVADLISTEITSMLAPQLVPTNLGHTDLPEDSNLKRYIKEMNTVFYGEDKSNEEIDEYYVAKCQAKGNSTSPNMKQKAHVLADFVVAQMSAMTPEPNNDCPEHNVDLHLADLMTDYNTAVISLGLIRCGGQLERAVLYKVLADRLSLPCSLTRNCRAYAWCEIAIPEPKENLEDAEQEYPVEQLRVNYVVDLSNDKEVRLHLKGSTEATKITGPPDGPKYIISRDY